MGVKIDAHSKELTTANADRLLANSAAIVDTFDNSVGRQALKDYSASASVTCLHVGLAADYSEIIWNEHYRVPSPANDHVCDYPLARNLVILNTAVKVKLLCHRETETHFQASIVGRRAAKTRYTARGSTHSLYQETNNLVHWLSRVGHTQTRLFVS